MKFTLGQLDLTWENPASNLEKLHDLIDRDGVGDVLVLPELWACGFSMNPECHHICAGVDVFLAKAARDYGLWLIAGLAEWNPERSGQENRLVLFDPDGNRVGHYAKHKLFTYAKEHGPYRPGLELDLVWDLGGIKVAPLICYELRFPELARNRVPEADVLIYSANWPQPRVGHWDTLLPARAIENQAYAMGVNRVGTDGNGWSFCGHSGCWSPLGERVLDAREDEGLFHVEIDPGEVMNIRQQLPFLKDMTS